MNRSANVLIILVVLYSALPSTAGFFEPHLFLSVEGGAVRSFLMTDSLMSSFFEPTSSVQRSTRPRLGVAVNLSLGSYLGIESGMGYMHFGQSTNQTTVLLQDDIFEHDFESYVRLNYFTVPFIVKAGIRRWMISVFFRFGIQPSLLMKKDIAWVIDGNKLEEGSARMPGVDISWWDAPLHFGGEAGVHFGKNAVFLLGQYNYGFRSIASGISGRAFNRSYGATLQYRRMMF
jgi:hypothetical protein